MTNTKNETKKGIFQDSELVGVMVNQENPEIEFIDNFYLDKDGTRYGITVIGYVGNYGNNAVGYVENGLLVIAGHGKAYLFNRGNYLSADYMHEKLCPKWSTRDAENIVLALQSRGYVNQRYNNSTIKELK